MARSLWRSHNHQQRILGREALGTNSFEQQSSSRRAFLQSSALGVFAFASTSIASSQEGATVRPNTIGKNAAASVSVDASKAAIAMINKGGNAIDGVVATALCLSVVDGHNSGIGGGGLMLLRLANGELIAIDGRETASRHATKGMFLRNGKADVRGSQDGPLACGVPGLIACLYSAHRRFGKLPWGDLFEPAIRLAMDGCPVSTSTANSIRNELQTIRLFPETARILCNADGSPLGKGELLVQKDLGRTLEQLAKNGPAWFYRGEFAERCTDHLRAQGGILDLQDFETYQAIDRPPLVTNYRGLQVVGFPPPSSGGIHIQQMLQILSRFPLREMASERGGLPFYHVLAEAMKLAFADRAFYLGDSDFVSIPSHITSSDYTSELSRKIDLTKSTPVPGHFAMDPASSDDEKKHTTHMTVADHEGNWVALTATVNTGWGNKMVVPGTGVVLNNEMDDFSISPGVPNAFGLVGSAANAIEPRKRPLSSMSPSMVLDSSGMPMMTCGAAGGPKIITATLQNVIRCIDLGMSIHDAISSSRLHHQWRPNYLSCEASLGSSFTRGGSLEANSLVASIQQLGHDVRLASSLAVAQGIERTEWVRPEEKDGSTRIDRKPSSTLAAACDPRAEGVAAVS